MRPRNRFSEISLEAPQAMPAPNFGAPTPMAVPGIAPDGDEPREQMAGIGSSLMALRKPRFADQAASTSGALAGGGIAGALGGLLK